MSASSVWTVRLTLGLLLLVAAAFGAAQLFAAFTASESNGANAFTTDTLDPPSAVVAADGATISITWTATPDTYAAGHRVLRSGSSGGPYSQIAQVTPRTNTSYVDAPAVGTYYYVLRAFVQNWESGNSNEDAGMVTAGGGVALLGTWVTGTTHVAEAGSDRALVVVVAREGGSLDLTAVSYGGQGLTQAVQVETASGTTRARSEIWVLTEAGITAASDATIALTWAGAPGSDVMVDSAFFGGVDQAAAIGATGSDAIIGDTPTTISTPALSTASGDMVVYGVNSGNAITYSPLNGFSEGNDQQAGATTTLETGYKAAAGSSETPSADADAAPRRQVIAGLVLQQAGAGCTVGDTGFQSASAEAADTGGDGDGFELNPTNAFADDAAFASNIDGNSDRHRYYDYGLAVPAGCVIAGIELQLDWWLDATNGNNSLDVELSWDGGATWTTEKTDGVESTTEHTAILGGAADTWGRTWALTDFSDANFRVRVTSWGNSARDFFLDWVAVKVHYTP